MVIADDFCNRYFCIINCRRCRVCQIPLYTQFFLKESLNWQPRNAKFGESLMLSLAKNSLPFGWFSSFWTCFCVYNFTLSIYPANVVSYSQYERCTKVCDKLVFIPLNDHREALKIVASPIMTTTTETIQETGSFLGLRLEVTAGGKN